MLSSIKTSGEIRIIVAAVQALVVCKRLDVMETDPTGIDSLQLRSQLKYAFDYKPYYNAGFPNDQETTAGKGNKRFEKEELRHYFLDEFVRSRNTHDFNVNRDFPNIIYIFVKVSWKLSPTARKFYAVRFILQLQSKNFCLSFPLFFSTEI